jgi:hypothetical protein
LVWFLFSNVTEDNVTQSLANCHFTMLLISSAARFQFLVFIILSDSAIRQTSGVIENDQNWLNWSNSPTPWAQLESFSNRPQKNIKFEQLCCSNLIEFLDTNRFDTEIELTFRSKKDEKEDHRKTEEEEHRKTEEEDEQRKTKEEDEQRKTEEEDEQRRTEVGDEQRKTEEEDEHRKTEEEEHRKTESVFETQIENVNLSGKSQIETNETNSDENERRQQTEQQHKKKSKRR